MEGGGRGMRRGIGRERRGGEGRGRGRRRRRGFYGEGGIKTLVISYNIS